MGSDAAVQVGAIVPPVSHDVVLLGSFYKLLSGSQGSDAAGKQVVLVVPEGAAERVIPEEADGSVLPYNVLHEEGGRKRR